MEKKNLFITIGITFSLFAFIIFLLYVVYCFAYYDKYNERIYITKINDNAYDFVYQNIRDNKGLSLEEFYIPIKLMSDKERLKDIYYTYYNGGNYKTLDEFINTYYFAINDIKNNDILFETKGKTGLFNRKKLYYSSIKLKSSSGLETSLGIKSNVQLKIEGNSEILLDGKSVKCKDNLCKIDYVFGGLHEVKYVSNGYNYYGLLNISKNEEIIDITNLESLIKVNNILNNSFTESKSDYNLKIGKFKLSSCFLDSGCPSKSKSYINLRSDRTCELYTYITLDQAGDKYIGTYEISGNFLIMHFDSHTYKMFDYDTKQASDIFAEVDMDIRYKIESDYIISNDSYKFKYAE